MLAAVRVDGRGVSIDVLVQPRASRSKLGPIHGDRIKIAVTAPPVDNDANQAVIELVARALGVPRSAVAITAGHSSRRKTLHIRTDAPESMLAAIASLVGYSIPV